MVTHSPRPDFVFLTGDLGFLALEPLRAVLGERFINAGVAEQNMVSVGAGLARNHLRPWLYSIAPFLYARPFEQIRNDVCLHRLPVVLVGNGGGYGYGVMGATHHALEDYGVLLTLPHMQVFVPAFDADVSQVVERIFECDGPCYLRLGRSEEPVGTTIPPFAAWRHLVQGPGPQVVVVGPLAGSLLQLLTALPDAGRPDLWALCQLPVHDVPARLQEQVRRGKALVVAEEHVATGSAGWALLAMLATAGLAPRRFQHLVAAGYPSQRYGSQQFHRRESGLAPEMVLATIHAAEQDSSGVVYCP